MPAQPASQALQGLKVLDLTRARAGPTTVKQLADWGADVIKIEGPEAAKSMDLGTRHGSDFQNLHRNKRSLILDLKEPDGLAVFMRMVESADVVVENYRPNVKHRLGVDYDSLKKVNPRIVLGSISGFGQDGLYAERPGLDQIAQGMGGHMAVTGEAGRGPMRAGIAVADMSAGLLCANAILMALLEREKSDEGQWVHTSLLEAQIFMLDFQAARWLMEGEVAGQAGNEHPTIVPTGTFETSDGYVNMSPGPSMWERFCKVLDAPELSEDPDYQTYPDRQRNRVRLVEDIQTHTRKKDSATWVRLLNLAGVPCGPILGVDETFGDPQVEHLGMAQTVTSDALGETTLVGQAIHMSRTPNELVRASPEPGENGLEVLAELGYSEAELADLKAREII